MDPIYITKETPIRIIAQKKTNSRPIAVPIVAVRSNRDVSKQLIYIIRYYFRASI